MIPPSASSLSTANASPIPSTGMALATSRRKLLFIAQCGLLIVTVLFLIHQFRSTKPSFSLPSKAHHIGFSINQNGSSFNDDADDWVPPSRAGRFDRARTLMPSILDPDNRSVSRMQCPPINATRYGYLRPLFITERPCKYVFVLNLRQTVNLLPRLLGSVIEAIRFLGPAHCALSIVEGNSVDGTLEVLRLLEEPLVELGVPYWLVSSPLNPKKGDRIRKLAILRALAVEPVTGPPPSSLRDVKTLDEDGGTEKKKPNTYWALPKHNITDLRPFLAPDAAVLLINDVSACAEDFLELEHQRLVQRADMTCAMDWAHGKDGKDFFYDVWIARGLDGDIFFDVPPESVSWARAVNLFPHEPVARARMDVGKPFQVFACWNGAAVFAAAPLTTGEVGFRWPTDGECFQGEVQLFCKDMWWKGHGRIAVVPSVNLQYTDESGRHIKKVKGYVSDFVQGKRGHHSGAGATKSAVSLQEKITWRGPPDMVKCMPTFSDQRWLPWNESLVKMEFPPPVT